MKLVLGKWATDRVMAGRSPEQIAPEAMAYLLRRTGGHGGIILLAPDGRYGLAHNTPRMAPASEPSFATTPRRKKDEAHPIPAKAADPETG